MRLNPRITATIFLALLTLGAIFVVSRSPYTYATQDRDAINIGVSRTHLTGTDDLGRDRTVRIAAALLLGLLGAAAAALLASVLAVGAGLISAFAAYWLSNTILFLSDAALTLPWLLLLMIVRAALPLNLAPLHSATLTFLLLGLIGWPIFVRSNHARAAALRNAGWLLHARANGLRPAQLLSHLVPHLRPLVITQFIVYIPVALVAEANLGAMGLGIAEPLPSWGSMLNSLQSAALTTNSRWIYLPVALLVLTLLLLESLFSEAHA